MLWRVLQYDFLNSVSEICERLIQAKATRRDGGEDQ